MIIQQSHAQAWKLPAFALFYILVSYLADMLSHALYQNLYRGYPSEWLYQLWYSYVFMWFGSYAPLSVPAWLLFHLSLLLTARSYYRSASARWGWGLTLSALACSAAGGYCVSFLYFVSKQMLRTLAH